MKYVYRYAYNFQNYTHIPRQIGSELCRLICEPWTNYSVCILVTTVYKWMIYEKNGKVKFEGGGGC